MHTFYNPTLTQETRENEAAETAFVGAIDSNYAAPKSFNEAWNNADIEEQEGRQKGIKKEYQEMINKGVWKVKKQEEIPSNRRLIGSKWVFKKKKNGTHHARLVALGYSQIPGVDYTDNFAPVVNDMTF